MYEYKRVKSTIQFDEEGVADLSNVKFGTLIFNLVPIPTKDGYTFDGWYTSLDLFPFEKVKEDFIMPRKNIWLFPKWNEN